MRATPSRAGWSRTAGEGVRGSLRPSAVRRRPTSARSHQCDTDRADLEIRPAPAASLIDAMITRSTALSITAEAEDDEVVEN